MNLGPLSEDDPAIPVIQKYATARKEQNNFGTLLAVLFGEYQSVVEGGVEIETFRWRDRSWIVSIQYVGTVVRGNVVTLPAPGGIGPPPPPPTIAAKVVVNIPIWDHLGHTLIIKYNGIVLAQEDTEIAFVYCEECDTYLAASTRLKEKRDGVE